ncbi:DNA topoisomerase 2-binding protein 1 [Geranomyces variabilis]|uniref:DNA topoisomerase 2-binding protein 1 n=1 Tax=Geranomyces variabilis TaxID=109894 RepID=A0AAD5TPL4_9FUNG|nr:DNA topoisomerase 2-binding protein 1 [Geranomyces variabilis]
MLAGSFSQRTNAALSKSSTALREKQPQQQQRRQQHRQQLLPSKKNQQPAALREASPQTPREAVENLKPIFSGVCISVTGFSTERAEIHTLVSDHGGKFNPNLTRECTHLIAEAPSGPKYEFASGSKKIHIVTRDWIADCISADKLLNEALYSIKPKSKSDVPASAKMPSSACLARCSIFLGEGFGDAQLTHIRKVVRELGGSLPTTFDEFVTHLVVAGKKLSDADHRLMRGGMRAVPVVSHTWLRDCYKNHALQPLQPYLVEQTEGWYRGRQESGGDAGGQQVPMRNARRQSHAVFEVDDFGNGIADATKLPPPARQTSAVPDDKEFNFVTFGKGAPAAGSVPGPGRPPEPEWSNDLSPVVKSRSLDGKPSASGKRGSSMGLRRSLTADIIAVESSFANSTYAHIEPTMMIDQTTYHEADALPKQPLRPIFAGMTLACTGFESSHENDMRVKVESLGGTWCDMRSLEHAGGERWLIVPLVSATRHSHNGVRVVSNWWLQRCVDENHMHNPADIVIFRPLETHMPIAGFEKLKIGISGYQDYERVHIGQLARRMGAKFTEMFTKANTHLLCKPGTDNAKPRKSRDWGIPVVSAEWLYACASKGQLLETVGFNWSSPDTPKTAQLSRAPTPGIARTGPKSVQARFDTAAALTSLETPAPPPRRAPAANYSASTSRAACAPTPASPPSPMSFTKRLGKAVQHARRRIKSEEDVDDDETPEAAQIPTRAATPSRSVSPTRRPVPADLLQGVVICFSLRLGSRRNELLPIARQLGAQVSSTYSDACTHFIYQSSRAQEQMKECKMARAAGKHVVSPEWLVQCCETGTRVKEGDYPHFFNPNRALAISNPASQTTVKATESRNVKASPSKRKVAALREAPAATVPADYVGSNGNDHIQRTTSNTSTRSDAPPANYDVMIDTLMDAKTLRRRSRPSFPPPPDTSRGSDTTDTDSGPTVTSVAGPAPSETAAALHMPQKQTEVRRNLRDEAAAIVYDDPEARIAKRKLMEQLEEPHGKKAKMEASVVVEPTVSAGPRFVLSGVTKSERVALTEKIKALGGTVHDDPWNDSVTHLVVPKLGRTEKCLAAIASGAWLVRPGYVRACADAGAFVDEEPWEWTLDGISTEVGDDDRWMHKAPRRWRQELGNSKRSGRPLEQARPVNRRGAFEGWQVLIAVNGSRRDGFQRLLSAGCASVHLDALAFTQLPRTPMTFVMTDQSAEALCVVPALYDLAASGMPFVNSNYCGQFLFNEGTAPSWDEWIVDVLNAMAARRA